MLQGSLYAIFLNHHKAENLTNRQFIHQFKFPDKSVYPNTFLQIYNGLEDYSSLPSTAQDHPV